MIIDFNKAKKHAEVGLGLALDRKAASSTSDDWIARARAVKLEDVLAQRGITLKARGHELIGPCPHCQGDDRFGVNLKKGLFNCRGCKAGGDVIALVQFLDDSDFLAAVETLTGERPAGRTSHDSNGAWRQESKPKGGKPAEYIYQLADGSPYLKVKRRYNAAGEKYFPQDHWDGSAWISGAPAGPKIPYRLPELLAAQHDDVFICEGEKDADNVSKLGLVATTNSEGADTGTGGKWTPDLNPYFKDKNVYILRDNDEKGEKHTRFVAGQLLPIVASARIVKLPNLPHKGDVSDWLEAGGTADQLIELVQAAPIFDPASAEEPSTDPSISPIPLTYFDDCGAFIRKRHILKGFLARGETSEIIGPPKSGKSALADEIVVYVAAGRDWRGHKSKDACGVVIFALERADQHKQKLAAYQQRDGLKGLPIAVAGKVIDLLDPSCIDLIGVTVREAEKNFGRSVGMIVIDTYNKGIAANGGDEDKARDANQAAAHLRILQEHLDLHVLLIGHTGKDQTRGARGSNAKLGDDDVMVQISGDGAVKTAQVIAANDQPERVLADFKFEQFELGRDEDGDPITTAIISNEAVKATVKSKGKKRLPAEQRRALELLTRCINDDGRPPPPSNNYPPHIRVVSLKEWHIACERGGLSSAAVKKDRDKAFRRAKDALQTMNKIACLDDWVWLVHDFNEA